MSGYSSIAEARETVRSTIENHFKTDPADIYLTRVYQDVIYGSPRAWGIEPSEDVMRESVARHVRPGRKVAVVG